MTLEQQLKKEKFYYVNSNLTSKNFPKPKKVATKNWKLIRMEKSFSSQEALDEIKKQGCRPANVYELLEWQKQHGDELKDYEWCFAFGQLWASAGGYHRVPYVYRHSDGDWYFNLGCFEFDWDGDYCLLAFEENTYKEIPLSMGKVALVDTEDYELLSSMPWHYTKSTNTGYARNTGIGKESLYMHNFLMKTPKGMQTDHIDGNGLNNRKANLKIVTYSENQQKAQLRVDNKSGIKGISFHKKQKVWMAHKKINNKNNFLGSFKDKNDAINAYNNFCDLEPQTLSSSESLRLLDLEEKMAKLLKIINI